MNPEEDPNPSATTGEGQAERHRATRWFVFLGVSLVLFVLFAILGLKWNRERLLTAECHRRFELLGRSAEKYAETNGGKYPYEPRALEYMLIKDLRHRKFLICPKSKRTYRWTRRERSRKDPPHMLLAWENPDLPSHGLFFKGHHALFVGARIKLLSRQELVRRLQEDRRTPPTPPRLPKRRRPGLSGRPGEKLPGYPPELPPGVKLQPLPRPLKAPGTGKKETPAPPEAEKPRAGGPSRN